MNTPLPLTHTEVAAICARWLQCSAPPVFPLAQVAREAFSAEPERGLCTQIGIALSGLGCVRIERRLESPRYLYRRPD